MAEGLEAGELSDKFRLAAAHLRSLTGKLSESQLLCFYGLYKQATEGPCLKAKPSWHQLTEKRKWEAWKGLKETSTEAAMLQYVELLTSLDPEWHTAPQQGADLQSWVRVSSMLNSDAELLDGDKTLLDWLKEDNLSRVEQQLAERIVDVNALDEVGLSLLHWAADRGSLAMVKLLVNKTKADVNVRDKDGQTPLHFASSCGHLQVLSFLLDSGADLNLADNDNQTPVHVACDSHTQAFLQQFI